MNTLVLLPTNAGLHYARIAVGAAAGRAPVAGQPLGGTAASLADLARWLGDGREGGAIDVLALRALYGGVDFPGPVIVDDQTRGRLAALGASAPLDVASTRTLIDEARVAFPGIPVGLAFETSFFVSLPARETTYALPGGALPPVRRWGYHGLFHDAATAELAQELGPGQRPARMLSICLEPRPEIAAVLGRHPLVVTGGSTPAQGLPGERNCGEIDPAIPLALAADPAFGPERANLLLTRESGFLGMLGYPATLAQVLAARRGRVARVREHLLYQMALAAGSGLAALAGLDGVVFSGRYAGCGATVAAELLPKIERVLGRPAGSLPWRVFPAPLAALVAEAAVEALLKPRPAHRVAAA
jgi:acetate kinase